MKLMGRTYYSGSSEWVIKSDSSLLNNGKPLFAPPGGDLAYLPCVVLRICRLGRGIAPKFAHRYFDACALGLDIFRPQLLADLRAEGKAGTEAYAFESSLVVGAWQQTNANAFNDQNMENLYDAIAQISEIMTIRQGDLLFIDNKQTATPLNREDVVQVDDNQGNELLYCKVK